MTDVPVMPGFQDTEAYRDGGVKFKQEQQQQQQKKQNKKKQKKKQQKKKKKKTRMGLVRQLCNNRFLKTVVYTADEIKNG